MKKIAISAMFMACLAASPACASDEVYGPTLTSPAPATGLDTASRLRLAREAKRWEFSYLALSAVDAAQTCDAIGRGLAYEANPIYGKFPSCPKIFAIKALTGGIHYLLFHRVLAQRPKLARTMAQISFAGQGLVVGLNARITFDR